MSEEIEMMLYSQVARDLLERFGAQAFDVASEARDSLCDLGDSEGEAIWAHISDTLGQMDCGQISAALH